MKVDTQKENVKRIKMYELCVTGGVVLFIPTKPENVYF